jgi:hypothetical protein
METTMSTHAFDTITQRAAVGLSRRSSLLTLGGAALAATIAAPDLSEAKKKKGPDCKKKEKQRCNSDAAACKSTINAICELEPAQCAAVLACCDTCSAAGFLTCFAAAIEA